MYSIPKEITKACRELRGVSTRAERLLWDRVRTKKLGYKFTRQHPICVLTEDSGFHRFIIADFYCAEFRLIIELDGTIHDIPGVLELDTEKELLLERQGHTVVRFKNEEVFADMEKVLRSIRNNLTKS